LTTGGLGQTDIAYTGYWGIPREFLTNRIKAYYERPAIGLGKKRRVIDSGKPNKKEKDSMWTLNLQLL